ncbi:unnamed protein product, partial [Closterium sp. NIES-53]
YVPIQACMHRVPTKEKTRGVGWPVEGKDRLSVVPTWLEGVQKGIYGRRAAVEFDADKAHWLRAYRTYLTEMEIEWASVRNVMDMDAHYGGFGAALEASAKPVWTMNVVPVTSPDTLPIIFDRGLLGVYHDWCESFNTYPRTYDMLHADRLLGAFATSSKYALARSSPLLTPTPPPSSPHPAHVPSGANTPNPQPPLEPFLQCLAPSIPLV